MPESAPLLPYAQRPWRPCVGMVLFNPKGQVFAARRIDTQENAWQFPQGGVDDGETPPQAALRELGEEISLAPGDVTLLAEMPRWLSYDLPEPIADRCWRGKYRGQTQKWFAFRLMVPDTAISIATAHPEFSHWQWMDLAQVVAMIVPFKRDIYQQVAAEFAPFAVPAP